MTEDNYLKDAFEGYKKATTHLETLLEVHKNDLFRMRGIIERLQQRDLVQSEEMKKLQEENENLKAQLEAADESSSEE